MKKVSKRMTNVLSALTARTRFLVARRGQPAVIILSVRDYMDTLAPAPQWFRQIGVNAVVAANDPGGAGYQHRRFGLP